MFTFSCEQNFLECSRDVHNYSHGLDKRPKLLVDSLFTLKKLLSFSGRDGGRR